MERINEIFARRGKGILYGTLAIAAFIVLLIVFASLQNEEPKKQVKMNLASMATKMIDFKEANGSLPQSLAEVGAEETYDRCETCRIFYSPEINKIFGYYYDHGGKFGDNAYLYVVDLGEPSNPLDIIGGDLEHDAVYDIGDSPDLNDLIEVDRSDFDQDQMNIQDYNQKFIDWQADLNS